MAPTPQLWNFIHNTGTHTHMNKEQIISKPKKKQGAVYLTLPKMSLYNKPHTHVNIAI